MIDPSFRYGDQEHDHYQKYGYYIFENFLTDAGLETCRHNIERTLEKLQPGRSSDRIISAHQIGEDWILELTTQPRLLEMIEKQIGPNVVLWSTHLLCKPPKTGREVPWHQDAPYWPIKGQLSSAIWIPFDDVDEENGAMAIIPGWHDKATLPRRFRNTKVFNEEIDPSALPENLDQIKVQYRLRAGQMAAHHTMLPHNSKPNRSERWRRVIVLRYLAADGELGSMQVEDFRNGEPFRVEGVLVRGEDILDRGWKRGFQFDL